MFLEGHSVGEWSWKWPGVLYWGCTTHFGATASGAQVRNDCVYRLIECSLNSWWYPEEQLWSFHTFLFICDPTSRLQQKRLYLQKQSQVQAYFHQMQLAEDPQQGSRLLSSPPFTRTQTLTPFLEPSTSSNPYSPKSTIYPEWPSTPPPISSDSHTNYTPSLPTEPLYAWIPAQSGVPSGIAESPSAQPAPETPFLNCEMETTEAPQGCVLVN